MIVFAPDLKFVLKTKIAWLEDAQHFCASAVFIQTINGAFVAIQIYFDLILILLAFQS
jgi:hypothetical protein